MSKKRRTSVWAQAATVLTGAFFLSAGMYKAQMYFFQTEHNLLLQIQYMHESGLMYEPYFRLLRKVLQFPGGMAALEGVTAFLQGAGGLLLILRRHTRAAGVLIILIQANIFLGMFHSIEFREFIGFSLWIGMFFIVRPRTHAAMRPCTLWLCYIMLLYLCCRLLDGDPWPQTASGHLAYIDANVASVSDAWRSVSLRFLHATSGAPLWLAWWLQLGLTLGLLTRFRLQAGAALLVIAVLRDLTLSNIVLSHGVIMILALLVWVTHEEWLRHRS